MTNNPRRLAASASTRPKGRWLRILLELTVLAVTLLVAGAAAEAEEWLPGAGSRAILHQPGDGEAASDPFWSSWGLQVILLAAVLGAYLIAVESALWLQKKPLRIIIQPRPGQHHNGTMRLVYFSFAISAIFFLNGQPWVGGVFLVFAAAYLLWRSRDRRRTPAAPRAAPRGEAAEGIARRTRASAEVTDGARPRRADRRTRPDLTPPRADPRRRARASSCRGARP